MTLEHPTGWSEQRAALEALQAELLAIEHQAAPLLARVHPAQQASAVNLLHYLAMRQRDHWQLQGRLAAHGLSSLGRSESHVLATLESVLRVLDLLVGDPTQRGERAGVITRERGHELLQQHTDCLFGPPPDKRRVRVMVTLASETADDPELVRELVRGGMDCARINAAHDDIAEWRRMAHNVRAAARFVGRRCQIAVDLPGPKCRTGALEPGPEVVKLRPVRGPRGEVLRPAVGWLTSAATVHSHTPSLPVPAAFLATLRVGDKLKLRDARGRARCFEVGAIEPSAVAIHSDKTAYLQCGTLLRGASGEAAIGALLPVEVPLILRVGDTLALTRAATPGRSGARSDGNGTTRETAHIPCEPPELLDMVREGEPVWLDDGRIGGIVTLVAPDAVLVRITAARPEGEKLRARKGINLPDTNITLAAFTELDEKALAFAAEAADIVSLSFIRDPADVHALQDRLATLGRPELGVILKIETRAGFERLPELLLAAMRNASSGVMIARGDLAVECGFQRLAEVQEEILWLCEAAHVPVVWATQVLETVAKTGRATRAEVTDAAMAERAECVMLNKGPYILQAVSMLDDILRRMSAHQHKKSAMFRPLHVAQLFQQRLAQLDHGDARP